MVVYDSVYNEIANTLGISVGIVVVLFAVISVWTLIWKGLALWKSAKKNHMIWFVVLLIVNTLGILEILYIYVFSKMGGKNVKGDGNKGKKVEKAKEKKGAKKKK